MLRLKRQLLLVLVLFSLTTGSRGAQAEDRDYLLHMTTAFMLNTAVIMAFKNEAEPIWLTTLKSSVAISLLGVSKELFIDGQSDPKDVLYNEIGILTSAALFITFPF